MKGGFRIEGGTSACYSLTPVLVEHANLSHRPPPSTFASLASRPAQAPPALQEADSDPPCLGPSCVSQGHPAAVGPSHSANIPRVRQHPDGQAGQRLEEMGRQRQGQQGRFQVGRWWSLLVLLAWIVVQEPWTASRSWRSFVGLPLLPGNDSFCGSCGRQQSPYIRCHRRRGGAGPRINGPCEGHTEVHQRHPQNRDADEALQGSAGGSR